MRTVRRVYFYAISLISLEVAVWGVIGLLRTLFRQTIDSGIASLLAGGLAQVLVAVPIFTLHWLIAQREADKDVEERASQVRALFHYSARLALLIPIVQNFLAIFNRLLLTLFGLPASQALIGGQQTIVDNLTALGVNLLVWFYLERVLKNDWRIFPPENGLHAVRRLFRAAWMLYLLTLSTGGASILLHNLFFLPENNLPIEIFHPFNGLALTLAALPLWTRAWQSLKTARESAEDKKSSLRLAVIYLLALVGILTALVSGFLIATNLANAITGDGKSLVQIVNDSATPLSLLLVFLVIWAFFQREMQIEFRLLEDAALVEGLWRIYRYLLSLVGLVMAYFGVRGTVEFLVHLLLERSLNMNTLRPTLSNSLGMLLVAMPLWLYFWNQVQAGARREDDQGEHTRRSPVRKGYLYLVLFLTVVGGMVTAGNALYLLLSQVLGNPGPTFAVDAVNWLQSFLLLLVLFLYHLNILRQDGRMLQSALARKHAAFPVLILTGGENSLLDDVRKRLGAGLPDLPLHLHDVTLSAPGSDAPSFKAVLIDGGILLRPPEWLPSFLAGFPGQKIILPREAEGWTWLGGPQRSERERANDAVTTLRQMAEGQTMRIGQSLHPLQIAGVVLAVVIGAPFLIILVGLALNQIR